MKSVFIILSFLVGYCPCEVQSKELGVLYFNRTFGHVHVKPENFSSSLTTLACAHPITVLEAPKEHIQNDWFFVKVGDVKGYIHHEFLSERRVDCLQDRFPKFFNALNLDLGELYYWGRLFDHFAEGESKAK